MQNNFPASSNVITSPLRLEIEALSVELAWLIDHGHADKAADLFTDNATFDTSAEVASGITAIREMLEKRAALEIRSRHIISNVRLVNEAADRVCGTVTITVYRRGDDLDGEPELVVIAEADDIYERDAAGCWRFAQRRVKPIFMRSNGNG